jgi:hypothetical protein
MLLEYPLKVNRIWNVDDPIPSIAVNGTTTVVAGIVAVGEIDHTVPQVTPSEDVSTFNVYGIA